MKNIKLYEEEFVHIGILKRAHGYKGHAKISIDDLYVDDLAEQKFIFIEVDGYHVPFKIVELKELRDLVIKFEGLDTPEDLNRYHNRDLYLLKKDLTHAADLIDEHDKMLSLAGLQLIDQNLGPLGTIDRIEEYPQQLMAILNIEDREVLIPLHPDLIIDLNIPDNKVIMLLPEGLV